MSSSHEPFTYKPLRSGQIRLLYLSPLVGESMWSLKTVDFQHQRLEAQIAYNALSYTWGDLSQNFPFICNNRELQIHRNLNDALSHLAKKPSLLPIWIDAVCINQCDDKEKPSQINMMRSIYKRADQVLVWLGCGSKYSKEAIALLPRIAEVGKELEGFTPGSPITTPESKGLPNLNSRVWQAVYDLLDNPWFCRLWVVQEASLARHVTVLYGSNVVNWNMLGEAIDNFYRLYYCLGDINGVRMPKRDDENNRAIFHIRQGLQVDKPWQHKLAYILILTAQHHHCSDPYDRVFGILGFAAEEQIQQIQLDYSMSLPDLYTKFTRFLLCSLGPGHPNWWEFLQFATTPKKMKGLPSWCPDFHAFSNLRKSHFGPLHLAIINSWCKGGIPYSASRGTTLAFQSHDLNELTVRGRIFDTLKQIHPDVPHASKLRSGIKSVTDLYQVFLCVRDWEKSVAQTVLEGSLLPNDLSPLALNNGENVKVPVKVTLDDYWRTLVSNVTKRDYTFTREMFIDIRRSLDGFAKWTEKRGTNWANKVLIGECAFGTDGDLELTEEDDEVIQAIGPGTPCENFVADILSTLRNTRLFTTSQGRFGFGPKTIQKGDVVCILNYAKATHILRQERIGDAQTFRLVGDAYVHGMMNGEIEMLDLEEQDITLV